VSLLLMVAVIALDAMFVLHGFELVADSAEELHRQSLARHGQGAQHTRTAARERASMYDASALIVLLSICIPTMVELAMLSAADRQRYASLHTAQHRQRVSANFKQVVVRQANVHVAVWD
jgi:hypothetical protein